MNRFALLPLLFALSTACVQNVPPPAPDTRAEDEATLRQMVDVQTAAWNGGDAAAWSKDFVPDADFINIVGTVFEGREQIEQRHAAIFATLFKGSQARVTVRRIAFLDADTAVVDTTHEVTAYAGLPPGVQATEPGLLRTQMRYVMKRSEGQWRIAFGQNTDVKPRPTP